MVLILTLSISNDYPKSSSKYRSMEQEKNTQILMKDSFCIRKILKEH